jgi:WD40 repeat protein
MQTGRNTLAAALASILLAAGGVALAQDKDYEKPVRVLSGHAEGISALAYTPDGSRLLSASSDSTVKVWDRASGSLLSTIGPDVFGLAFSPAGDRVAALSNGIDILDIGGNKLMSFSKFDEQGSHTSNIVSAAFSPDGTVLATGSWDDTVKLWSLSDGSLIRTLEGHGSDVNSVAFSPDGALLAGSGWGPADGKGNNSATVWTVADGTIRFRLEGHKSHVDQVRFSPDGSRIATASDDRTVRLWSSADGQLLHTFEGELGEAALSVAFSPDGAVLATGWWDNRIRFWTVEDGRRLPERYKHGVYISDLVFSPDGVEFAAATDDPAIAIWTTPTP